MNFTEIAGVAMLAKFRGAHVALTVRVPWLEKPAGFPAGVLQNIEGGIAVYAFDPNEILGWMAQSGIILFNIMDMQSLSVH